MERIFCQLTDIVDGDALAFDHDNSKPGAPGLFVIREDEKAYCYVNGCPHLHITLDFVPGRFMNKRTGVIQCTNHDARFQIENGKCIWGLCKGGTLTSLPIRIADGAMILEASAGVDVATK